VSAASSNTIDIVPLRADEWQDLKRLRIGALTESPDSFSPTAASALAHDDAYWQRGAQRAADSPDFEMFIVRRGGHGLGLGSAGRDEHGVGHIGAMWVDPSLRGHGVGARLFDACVEFLRRRGCASIELSVTETNAPAIALYQSRGFVLTGTFEPLRDGSPLKNLFMRWSKR
jgi:ribosomal protein S18 acetylase RimI-like enzyme